MTSKAEIPVNDLGDDHHSQGTEYVNTLPHICVKYATQSCSSSTLAINKSALQPFEIVRSTVRHTHY